MKLKELDESKIRDIGRAFGYYDYGGEKGLVSAYSGPEATAEYICGYVRGMLKGGFLYATSERGEGYIAFKRPGEKNGLKTAWPLFRQSSSSPCALRMGMIQYHSLSCMFTLMPLTSTPPSAGMRMYFRPFITRVSIR